MLFGISAILLHLRWLWGVQSCVAHSELLMLDCTWSICVALRAPCCGEVQAELGLSWLGCGWAGSPLAAAGLGVCAQPPAVPAAKISPKLGLADRRGVAVFQEEMRSHFTILAWPEK